MQHQMQGLRRVVCVQAANMQSEPTGASAFAYSPADSRVGLRYVLDTSPS
jgi:hypothetical protein